MVRQAAEKLYRLWRATNGAGSTANSLRRPAVEGLLAAVNRADADIRHALAEVDREAARG
jgi:hypothetical protein